MPIPLIIRAAAMAAASAVRKGRVASSAAKMGRRARGAREGMSWLERGWAAQMLGQLADASLPRATRSVVVTVKGSRLAKKDDLYKLAISIATGIVKRFQSNTGSLIEANIDHMNRVVQVKLAYDASGTFQGTQLLATGSGRAMIKEVVSEIVTGGKYPPFISDEDIVIGVPGVVGGVGSLTDNLMIDGGANTIPEARVQNPQPQFDLGRTSDFTALITAAINPPCCDLPTNYNQPYPKIKPPVESFDSRTNVLTNFFNGEVGK